MSKLNSGAVPAKSYFVGDSSLTPVAQGELDRDPRGIVWVWEPPDSRATYVMGIDPTLGVTMWNRLARSDADAKLDNACIQVIRIGRGSEVPDRQVAEYAAPVDPEDLADVANTLGRVYGGNSEDGQALCIIEIYPGPGLLTQRKMLSYGYTNMWFWSYLDTITRQTTKTMGWTSSQKSARDLFIRTSRHIIRGGIRLNSPWLIEEMADSELDQKRMRADHIFGKKIDRLTAMQLAIWAAREWQLDVETVKTEVRTDENKPDYQQTDVSLDDMMDAWEEKFCSLMEEN